MLCNGISNYSILGSTLDDALGNLYMFTLYDVKRSYRGFCALSGEAFDKASRMLQLSTGIADNCNNRGTFTRCLVLTINIILLFHDRIVLLPIVLILLR